MTPPWLTLLGLNEDGPDSLSPAATALLQAATLVVGGARHLALAEKLIGGETLPWPSPLTDAFPAILARRGEPVVVLASGDPFCHGVGASLAALVPMAEILCLPAPSAFSLACARLGWSLPEVATLSFCGHPPATLRPLMQPGRRALALSADADTPAQVCALLRAHGFGASTVHILEALGGPRERIRATSADSGPPADVQKLNLLAIEFAADPAARVLPRAPGLPEAWFEHDGQITKAEIRAVTLAALAPLAGELLWDVGCGSGSVSIEWLLCHPANRAIAVEARPERAARAARNALAFGVPRLPIVTGEAPAALAGLPRPDKIFLGGGVEPALEPAWTALRPGGRMVANAVTIETEAALFAAHRAHGGTLTRLSVDRLDRVGDMHGFRPAMTVTQWTARKPRLIAGLGFRKDCTAQELAAIVRRAGELLGSDVDALAAPEFKANAEGVREAARSLGLHLIAVSRPALEGAEAGCVTRSTASQAATGIDSVAEASALAAAGPGGRLRLLRIADASATCAVAEAA